MSTATLPPMPAPVLPETAPFSGAQRAWLNGFFAGMLGAASGGAASTAVVDAAPAPAAPAVEEDFPWHDASLDMTERLKLAEGRPRERVFMAAMAQLDCGACGYLCKTYAEAIAAGTERDLGKCSPGGKPTLTKLKELVVLHPPTCAATTAATPTAAPRGQPVYDRNNPFPARFEQAAPLCAVGSAKDTRHVVVDVRGSGMTYAPGDSLGVFPENCPDVVQEAIDLLGCRGGEDVPGVDGQHASLREALLRDYALGQPTDDLLDLLARAATDPADVEALRSLRADPTGDALHGLEVADLLTKFRSARPAPGDFTAALAPLRPRLYSISSSPRVHPDQIHLTVGVVRFANAAGRTCKGPASTFLCERLRPGQRVRVFVQKSHGFTLPSDPDVPVIMVGPGTGVAPFRAFLQDRKAAGATGMNWLFFGDQREAFDFLYRDELEQFRRDGVLTRLDTAFSRDRVEKVYVQHRMIEHGREIWDWIGSGACLYVCGDAKRMAADVDAALRRIVADHGGMSPEAAGAFVDNLSRNMRYKRDVY